MKPLHEVAQHEYDAHPDGFSLSEIESMLGRRESEITAAFDEWARSYVDAELAMWKQRAMTAELRVHKLECVGAFSLDRDPFALEPAIDAYAEDVISRGKMRECVRRWLAGADFRLPAERDWNEVNE